MATKALTPAELRTAGRWGRPVRVYPTAPPRPVLSVTPPKPPPGREALATR